MVGVIMEILVKIGCFTVEFCKKRIPNLSDNKNKNTYFFARMLTSKLRSEMEVV